MKNENLSWLLFELEKCKSGMLLLILQRAVLANFC